MSNDPSGLNTWHLLHLVWVGASGYVLRIFDRQSKRLKLLEEKAAAGTERDRNFVHVHTNMNERIERLEAGTQAVALMSQSVTAMATTLSRFQDQMRDEHVENKRDATEDRRLTREWRDNTMTPFMKDISQQLAAAEVRIASHERRIDELEQSKRRNR